MVGCALPLECASVGEASGALPVSWTWMSVLWGYTAAARTLVVSTSLDGTPATACLATSPFWQTTVTSCFVKVVPAV